MKILFSSLLAVVLSMPFLLSCSGKKSVEMSEKVSTDSKEFSTAINWIKNKRDTIDVQLTFHNGLSHPVHFNRSAISMSFEGMVGAVTNSYFNVELQPGGSQTFTLIFDFHTKLKKEGVAKLTIDPMYKGTIEAGEKNPIPKYTRDIKL